MSYNQTLMNSERVIIIFGPTSSGKTALSLKITDYISKKSGIESEIISADSRQVYKGMNIGTAKVSKNIQKSYRHHFLDILPPTKQYSSREFAKDAKIKIDEITDRGHIPIIVGGTGTYVMGLVGDSYMKGAPGAKKPSGSLMLVPAFERQSLYRKIEANVDQMLKDGLYGELKNIISNYHAVPKQIGKTHGYREFIEYAKQNKKNVFKLNQVDLEKIKHRIKVDTKKYAMHQIGWLNKMEGYQIVKDFQQVEALIDDFLGVTK